MRSFLIAFGIVTAAAFFTMFGYYVERIERNKSNPVNMYNPRLMVGGKVIDLPEELSVAKPSDNLGVEITEDTIYIYFKTIINYPK